jgi:hypothetical protein
MASITIYTTNSFYNGEIILGWKVEGEVDVNVVDLDLELPDPWDIESVEDADAALEQIAVLSEKILDLDGSNDEQTIEREWVLDDLDYYRDEIIYIAEDLENGLGNHLHRYDYDAVVAAAERSVAYDDDEFDPLAEA